jgi:hypothetical protein
VKIKSIKRTENFKLIKFSQIFPKYLKEEQSIKSKSGHKVLTPNGWQPVMGFYKTKPLPTVKVITKSGRIECSEDHLIETSDGLFKAKWCDRKVIKTINGYQRCKVVKTGKIKNLYDIQIPAPNIWYTSGIHSHNSILLPHSGIACVKRGCKVLHITLELSDRKTQLRYASAISNVEMHKRFENKTKMSSKLEEFNRRYKGDLVIYDLPPDETSVDHIYSLISQLRKQKNWNPDVVIIDYLEQLAPRNFIENEYARQKAVATQIRGLARRENVLVFTATQTNRPDKEKGKTAGPNVIGVNRVAESFGKMMPMDYVVSGNQTEEERNAKVSTIRLWIAKNRNGPRDKLITIKVNYKTMKTEQVIANRITRK